jgi:hypothetical protein
MTQQEFDAIYPTIIAWIHGTLAQHEASARPVDTLGFKRLLSYFPPDFLANAKVVYVPSVPVPPLSAIGLPQFADFENMKAAGITYLDTFFSREEMRGNEAHHFHELIHVIQWQELGPRSFLAAYADGLERCGYRESPLEVMAYDLEYRFETSETPFDAPRIVRDQLRGFGA